MVSHLNLKPYLHTKIKLAKKKTVVKFLINKLMLFTGKYEGVSIKWDDGHILILILLV